MKLSKILAKLTKEEQKKVKTLVKAASVSDFGKKFAEYIKSLTKLKTQATEELISSSGTATCTIVCFGKINSYQIIVWLKYIPNELTFAFSWKSITDENSYYPIRFKSTKDLKKIIDLINKLETKG